MKMNAKTAKKLRKMAATIQEMEVKRNSELDTSFHYLEDTATRKTRKLELNNGETVDITSVGTIRVNPYSLRGIYRNLKKQIKGTR